LALLGSLACGDLVGNAELPAGVQSPNTYNTVDGALGVYRGTKAYLTAAGVMRDVIIQSGALTDELAWGGRGTGFGSIGATGNLMDERVLNEGVGTPGEEIQTGPYSLLQRLRGSANQSIGLLEAYAPTESPALRGEMYALEGYAEVLLAELYCSGVPLSTLDFQEDFTYKPSSTTREVFEHASALFDSALAISADSATVLAFARVLKGRALLNLGDYSHAAQAVKDVPTDFRYESMVEWKTTVTYHFSLPGDPSWIVATSEGKNGVPFVTSNDPRVQVTVLDTSRFGLPQIVPSAYTPGSVEPVVLAGGIEARLIEAEAALHATPADGRWLTILNALRTTCTDAASCPTPAPPGSGGVAGLPPFDDPGAALSGTAATTARVNLLFRERAYWLFLTGHRQGDLRRLVRAVGEGGYGRPQDTVYPTGLYFGGLGSYGSDVNFPVPPSERTNPLFHGCLSREA
jgi:hypothetical protein